MTIFLIVVILSSCQDPLGYDPNVSVSKIGQDTIIAPPDTVTTPTIIKIDSINVSFKEYFMYQMRLREHTWTGKTTRRKILLDTAGINNKIWIDWAMVSNVPDEYYFKEHLDSKVNNFELIFGAVLQPDAIRLNKDKKSLRWFSLGLKRLPNQKIYVFNPSNNLNTKIMLINNNKSQGKVTLLLTSDLPMRAPFLVKKFEGLIDIYYKIR